MPGSQVVQSRRESAQVQQLDLALPRMGKHLAFSIDAVQFDVHFRHNFDHRAAGVRIHQQVVLECFLDTDHAGDIGLVVHVASVDFRLDGISADKGKGIVVVLQEIIEESCRVFFAQVYLEFTAHATGAGDEVTNCGAIREFAVRA